VFWLYLYIAALILIAVPVAVWGRSQVAATVLVVWLVGHVAYIVGAPEPQTQAAIYGCAFWFWFVRIWLVGHFGAHDEPLQRLFAIAIFVPLGLISTLYAFGDIPEVEWWWAIYWLAVAQLALLTRPIAWVRTLRAWLRFRRSEPTGLLMAVLS
jgi:hypothetical protein